MKERIEIEKRFVDLINENQKIIYKICNIYYSNNDDREDLFQEIVLQLWKSYPGFRGESKFSTWLYRVALNTAITITKKPKLFVDMEEPPEIPYNERDYEKDEKIRVLYKAIGKLQKVEKAIIFLWLEDRTYEEIAETTGLTANNVSVKLVRIKFKLSKIIGNIQ